MRDRHCGVFPLGVLGWLIADWEKCPSDSSSTRDVKEKVSDVLESPECTLLVDRLLCAVEFPPITSGESRLGRFDGLG